MKSQGTRLVSALAAFAVVCTLLLHLLYRPLSAPTKFSQWEDWTPWNYAEEELVVKKLSMLVEGEDLKQLRSKGFSCHKDVHTHFCLSSTQVRFQADDNKQLKIYQPYANGSSSGVTFKPYARQHDELAMVRVSPVQIYYGQANDTPQCDVSHNVPAVVFSFGGYSSSVFHAFSETILPLFLTTRHFNNKVQFVISDVEPVLVNKYKSVFTHLSDYDPISLQDKKVHCFPGAVLGLQFHRDLGINSTQMPKGYDTSQFRSFLRECYSLPVSNVRQVLVARAKPVILLIARRSTRLFLNENEIIEMMTSSGYDVIVADPSMTEDLGKFSKVVNRCSVIVGVHGAGMTNLVFLPANAVVVQVVPIGIEWTSNMCYGEPVTNMDLKYVLYQIEPDESSLADIYGRDSPVLTDPMSRISKDPDAYIATYLNGQNFKINLLKFKETLIQVHKYLNTHRLTL